jgi:hypothetical protein
MVNFDNMKDDAKDKMHEGQEKFDETKDRIFDKDQNGNDDYFEENQEGMHRNESEE